MPTGYYRPSMTSPGTRFRAGGVLVVPEQHAIVIDVIQNRVRLTRDCDRREDPSAQHKPLR
jgi:hypothetical protein